MLLEKIKSPQDVKALPAKELPQLCEEIRGVLMQTVSQNGGHLASNLGVVELTVALHRQFQSPQDKIIFDVGHQSYTHKLLTGRYDRFLSLRRQGGVSGFTRPEESEHDLFVSGHSSTSVSAGLGLAIADTLSGASGFTISVVGDGALTGGLAYEGLNNAGRMKSKRHIIVLNDNKMSISGNVGGIAKHLAAIRIRPGYSKAKNRFSHFLLHIPLVGRSLHHIFFSAKTLLKNMIYHSTIFEELGFSYIGPIDGHDISQLEKAMEAAKHTRRPPLIHIRTCKGKGYALAEKTPQEFHGVSSGMDLNTGECAPVSQSFSHIFGKTLCRLAQENPNICAITAAMCAGTGLDEFAQRFPDRFFDVGIAEGHAITFASGLAKGGKIPVVAIYSSFLQRGYDQLVHDVAAQGVKVILCVDRAGVVGEDGEMHHGLLDVSFLRSIPGAKLYSPSTFQQLEQTLEQAVLAEDSLIAIRYPRGNQPQLLKDREMAVDVTVFSGENRENALVSYGRIAGECEEACQKLGMDHIVLNQLKPLPKNLISTLLTYKKLYFIEESAENGGVAQEILATLCKVGYNGSVRTTCIGDRFVPHATVSQLLQQLGMTADAIIAWVKGEQS